MLFCSLVGDRKFVDDVQITHHHAELLERDLSVEVSISLDNGAINELL